MSGSETSKTSEVANEHPIMEGDSWWKKTSGVEAKIENLLPLDSDDPKEVSITVANVGARVPVDVFRAAYSPHKPEGISNSTSSNPASEARVGTIRSDTTRGASEATQRPSPSVNAQDRKRNTTDTSRGNGDHVQKGKEWTAQEGNTRRVWEVVEVLKDSHKVILKSGSDRPTMSITELLNSFEPHIKVQSDEPLPPSRQQPDRSRSKKRQRRQQKREKQNRNSGSSRYRYR
tara:strand:- start:366 stop:1061 length:696 start_codon:yes stop_codon:yes gene_type:complete